MYEKLIPLVASALAVLILGMWNPRLLQKRIGGQPTGSSDPKWLALAGFGAGIGATYLVKLNKTEKIMSF